ncbi:binding-protein-dependent transport system inner membrane component [Biostraticola tofi]|uniref:Binding-protein-dependent transport system inner membrane component n=2 Tax=Biostraticola tofi TaxID=466109 RepID=A0A4R3YRY7_9GAMM|nr:binding-protein-dependent transport system inner membrane component [Biostraticola tofi]
MQRMTETLKVMFSGYLGGCLAGLLLGMLIGRIKIGYLLLEPLLELARPIAIAAIIPILMLFLGLGDGLKIGAVVIASFFPAIINTYSAMRATPQTLEETSLTFGLSRLQATLLVALPHALPVILIDFDWP